MLHHLPLPAHTYAIVFAVASLLTVSVASTHAETPTQHDLIIYGGTPAGLVAAIAASRESPELSILVIEPSRWIGGVVTGGLSRTDNGREETIGGITREFFELAKSLGGKNTPMWYAEPGRNLQAFQQMLDACGKKVHVITGHQLTAVEKNERRITGITLDDGSHFHAAFFIDASYEGDLMAKSGVSYIVGRESRAQYAESLAGYTPMPVRAHDAETMNSVCSCVGGSGTHFIHGTPAAIDAFDADGQLIAGVVRADPKLQPGDADGLTQAYNFRLCVTQRKDISVPFPKPENYAPERYQLLLRLIKSYPAVRFGRLVHLGQIANGKFDLNAQGLFSTDYAGGNVDYPDGDPETRAAIYQDHVDYVQGFLWFLGHDPRVLTELRNEVNRWGLCADEFTDNDHFSPALYVREARRMIGEYVMRQQDTWTDIVKPDSIAMGSFILDCHIVQRIVTAGGKVADEGSFLDSPTRPYQIAYRSLLPKRDECENLLVPVCLSASHIACCSIRMEPVYMSLGHASGVSAALALREAPDAPSAHNVPVAKLQEKLREQNAVLHLEGLADLITVDKLSGIVVDDRDASFTGTWTRSAYGNPIEGMAAHDANDGKGKKSARFDIDIPKNGRYEVRFAYAASSNRASAAPITIEHSGGTAKVSVDQRKTPEHDQLFTSLGTWTFSTDKPAVVTVHNDNTDSFVSVDAVQLIEVAP